MRRRMVEYGNLFEELHIIVYMRKSEAQNLESRITISKNVWAYPTNTSFRPFYFFDAYKIAKQIFQLSGFRLEASAITAQDPFETGLIGYLLKRKFKIPFQIQVHTDFLSPLFFEESFKNKLRVPMGKWLVKKADCVRVVSSRIMKSLIISKPVSLLPIFVDLQVIGGTGSDKDFLRKKYPNSTFFILMVARLSREKNIGLAIEALSEIIKNNPQTALIVVGSGPERDKLSKKAIRFGVGNNVIFEGWQDNPGSYYQSADLFLSTSNYEGYGMAAVSAAAAGVPILMSDSGIALGEIFPVGNKKILVEKLSELIKNAESRRKIAERQIEYIKTLPTKEEYLKRFKESLLSCRK